MNDRFRFRVWNKENKEMIYNAEIAYDGMNYNTSWQIGKNTNDGWVNCFGYYLDYPKDYEIMQCIGLKDKNGKLIYEGDILGGIYHGYIEYCDECKCFQLKVKDYGCLACEGDLHWYELVEAEEQNELEVIGNIYQDSHLIEN